MKKIIEVPDREYKGIRLHDVLKIYVRDNEVEFVVEIDYCRESFIVPKKELKELVGCICKPNEPTEKTTWKGRYNE